MISFKHRRRGKVRIVRFVPHGVGDQAGAKLEGRALTAPALWRHSPLDPETSQPHTSAWADSASASQPGNQASINNTQTVQNITTTATGMSQVFDLADSMPPATPVPNYTVAADTDATVHFQMTGAPAGATSYAAGGGSVGEDYILAYDSAGPGPQIYLVEHFSAHLEPPTGTSSIAGGGVNISMYSNAVSFSILADPNSKTSPVLAQAFGSNSGYLQQSSVPITYFNVFGGTVSYTWNNTDFDATSKTLLTDIEALNGTIPIAARGGDYGSVQGLRWSVGLSASVGLSLKSTGSNASGTIELTTHYDAKFTTT